MKTIKFLFIALVLLTFSEKTYSNDFELFTYNSETLAQELFQLNEIEKTVFENNSLDVNHLFANGLLSNTLETKAFFAFRPGDDNIPAFYLGCCLGPIGIAILLSSKDSSGDDVGKAIFGCLFPSAIFALGIYTDDPMLIKLAIEIFIEVWTASEELIGLIKF